MLSARDLTLRRGPEPLFERVNFTIFRGNKVGLTGANGSGKSSLFAAIQGDLGPDRGEIERPSALKIAHVEQEVSASDRPAIEFVLDGDNELRGVMAAIEDAERRDAAMELAELYASLQAIDGYRARARAAALMHGLGFKSADLERSVSEFSGGWRVRLAMARALGSRADLLLLATWMTTSNGCGRGPRRLRLRAKNRKRSAYRATRRRNYAANSNKSSGASLPSQPSSCRWRCSSREPRALPDWPTRMTG